MRIATSGRLPDVDKSMNEVTITCRKELDGSPIRFSTWEGAMAKMVKVTMYRSAKTGKAVTKEYAEKHKSTTEKETYMRKAPTKKRT
jgi:hypothetical protein